MIGVCAIQGDYAKHIEALEHSGVPTASICEVRTPEELAQVDRLILPGGESTTVGLLMHRYGLGQAIQEAAATGMPIWGTCMGMILLARSIESLPDQYSLKLLDISVQRNAFGAQVHSFEDEVTVDGIEHPTLGVFIRAPIVTEVGPAAVVIARYHGKVVGVRQGKILGTSFHPELTSDQQLHQYFMKL